MPAAEDDFHAHIAESLWIIVFVLNGLLCASDTLHDALEIDLNVSNRNPVLFRRLHVMGDVRAFQERL